MGRGVITGPDPKLEGACEKRQILGPIPGESPSVGLGVEPGNLYAQRATQGGCDGQHVGETPWRETSSQPEACGLRNAGLTCFLSHPPKDAKTHTLSWPLNTFLLPDGLGGRSFPDPGSQPKPAVSACTAPGEAGSQGGSIHAQPPRPHLGGEEMGHQVWGTASKPYPGSRQHPAATRLRSP